MVDTTLSLSIKINQIIPKIEHLKADVTRVVVEVPISLMYNKVQLIKIYEAKISIYI